MYMREYWVQVQKSPVVYKYIYWSITVPLQMIEFDLILKAARGTVGSMMFERLLGGAVAMLAFGYANGSCLGLACFFFFLVAHVAKRPHGLICFIQVNPASHGVGLL